MQTVIGVLCGFGVRYLVEWFADIPTHAGIIIAGVSSGVIACLMDVWRDRAHGNKC